MSLANAATLEEVRKSIRGVLQRELVPRLEDCERRGVFDSATHRELGKLGLVAPMLPEAYGGSSDLWAQLVLAEEMGRLCSGFGLSSLASSCLFGANVARSANENQKKKYLPLISSGEKMGCWALTEPEVGSNAVGIKTQARRKGERFILNGTKTFVTNAPIADYFIVIAREIKEDGSFLDEGFKGASAFILERGMKGLSTGVPFKKQGHRSSPTGEIFLENVEVSKEHLLGDSGQAFFDMKHSLDVERIVFSGLAIGMMSFCLEKTCRYTQERQQFGVPIASFQMIQDMIAQMSTLLEVSREYLYSACEKLVSGVEVTKEAAIAKIFLAESVNKVTNMAVQCHGGYGYTEEYLVERYMRDAKLFEIGAGTSEIQKLIIAKQTLKEYS